MNWFGKLLMVAKVKDALNKKVDQSYLLWKPKYGGYISNMANSFNGRQILFQYEYSQIKA